MTPTSDYIFVVVVLAAVAATALVPIVLLSGPRTAALRHTRRAATAAVEDIATELAMPPQVLGVLLGLGPVLMVAFGVLAALPPAVLGAAVLVGAVTPVWFLSARLDVVRRRRDEAVVAMARDLADRIAGTPLNQVVRSLGMRPPHLLRSSMAVLADIDRPLDSCLAACAERSRSELMNRFCVYVVLGLKADVTAFRELLPTTILPHLEGLLRQRRARAAALAYQRGVITIMGTVLVVLFTVLYLLGPAYRAFYAGATGAATIAGLIAGFALLVALVHAVLRTPRRPQWRVDLLITELGKY